MKIIDKATCLCIDQRFDERRFDLDNMGKRLGKLGADWECFHALTENGDPWTPYDYVDVPKKDLAKEIAQWGYGRDGYKHHHWNALHCHRIMIQKAKEEGRKNLLIVEDDAYMTDRFETVFDELSQFSVVKNNSYHILYFGWWISDENDEFNKNIEKNWEENGTIRIDKVTQLGGLHGALINETMFDALLTLPANNPWDCQLNQFHNKLQTYYVEPKMFHTRTTFSHCEGSVIKRKDI